MKVTQGQGPMTIHKEANVATILHKIYSTVHGMHRSCGEEPIITHCDLNCGDGYNMVEGRVVPGSPMIAIKKAIEFSDRVGESRLYFIDANPESIKLLEQRIDVMDIPSNIIIKTHCGSNVEFIEKFEPESFGSILIDPTRPSEGYLTDQLEKHKKKLRMIDLIIHISGTQHKRIRCAGKNDLYEDVIAWPERTGKKHHHVSDIKPGDSHHWVTNVLTNNRKLTFGRRNGWWRADEQMGKRIIRRVTSTNEEIANGKGYLSNHQIELF